MLGRYSASYMSFTFVFLKDLFYAFEKLRRDFRQTFCQILMYCGFAYPKFLRRLPYRGIVVYDVIGDGYRTFFNILLQNESPEDFFISYAGDGRNSTPCTDYSVINIVIVQDGSSS